MTVAEVIHRFPSRKVLVVGDVCLDRWCSYDPRESEPSRETGIPRIAVVRAELTPGAAGTIANNLAALRVGTVSVLGILGDDGHGYELRQALQARGIGHDLCIVTPRLSTFTYTKLLNCENGEEDRPRIDFINNQPLPAELEQKLVDRLWEAVPDFDVVIISDQAETSAGGVVTGAVRDGVAELAQRFPGKTFWVDSRERPEHFRRVIVKPNEEEARRASLRAFGEVDFARLRAQIEAPLLVVTHGSKGVLLVEEAGETWVETKPVAHPVDICGAGDSFSAGAAVALSLTGDARLAAEVGNRVASVTIMKKGTGTASPEEVCA